MIIRAEDLSRVMGCRRGGRKFCRDYGLDWQEFIENGFDERILLATGDQMAIDLVEAVKRDTKLDTKGGYNGRT